MKKVRNVVLSVLAALLTLTVAGVILTKVFEGKVIAFLIKELNRKLSTEISVQNATFSLFRKFPDATVIFNEVLIRSVQKDLNNPFSDTLLSADRIMLSFNILEIINKQYLLQDIYVNNGFIQVLINNQGQGNFDIWQGGSETGQTRLQIKLQQVRLTNTDLLFKDDAIAAYLSLHSDKVNLKGDFTGTEFALESSLQGNINIYHRDGITYIRNQPVAFDLIVDQLENRLRIKKASLLLDKVRLTGQGEVLQAAEKIVNLQIRGQDIKFGAVVKYLPVLIKKIPSDLNYHGQFDVLLNISGPVSKTKMPHIEAACKIKNAGIAYRKKKIQIEKINLSGVFNNGRMNNAETTVILVNDFSAVFRNSLISGSLNIRNLKEPEVEYVFESKINLQDITDLFKMNSLQLSGNIQTTLNIKGRQNGILSFKKNDLVSFNYKGVVQLTDLQATFQETNKIASNVNANITVDKYLIIDKLTGNICNNDLSISGRLDNVVNYFVNHSGNLWADLNLYSDNFSLDSVLAVLGSFSGNKEQPSSMLPDNLYIKLKFWFNRFGFFSFKGTNITGDLFYKPEILVVNQFTGSTMSGSMNAKGSLEANSENNYIIRGNSKIDDVEIKDLFTSFDNFGQDFIQARHIKGDLSGSIYFYGEFDKNFKILLPTILTDGDLVIKNGELIGFEPLEKLSKFIDIQELSHIRFSDLQNEVFISKEQVIIPQMNINSSALNLTASGIHGFDNYYNYKIKLSLSEFLSKKLRPDRQPGLTQGVVEDKRPGRTNIYLSIDGTPSDMKISYDKEAALSGFKDKMNAEKNLMKSIISEEFGKTNKDTVATAGGGNKNEQQFFIDWQESEKPLKKQDTTRIVKKEKFILEWEEDTLR